MPATLSFGAGAIVILLLALLAISVRVLREYERGVVFQLGRFWAVKGPGLVILIPVLQQMVRVDLRTIVPFDDATVAASVRRTGRCVVVAEAAGFAGVGAEVAARVQERCFHSLLAPVLRVTGFDVPYPPPMVEHRHLPDVERILDALERLQRDDEPDVRYLPEVGAA